ncbi:sensor histidine kinase [Alteromonas sp. A079]|uniref:sensor histidine kinase n=1 Tax=Alteromonas sp. A079 TaxID=3410268 RepID=UPI003BA1723A
MQSHTFQLDLNEQLCVTHFSSAFSKVCKPLQIGTTFSHAFSLVAPKIPISSQVLTMFDGQLVTISPTDNTDIVLGGTFYKTENGFTFLGYPQLTTMGQLAEMGLSLSDFVGHDPINFYIGTLQLKASMYEDLTALNKELKASAEHLESLVALRTKELLQSEKMASLGTLAAGVAHEINNPIGFIMSNLSSLDGYMNKILPLLSALNTLPDEQKAQIEKQSGTMVNWNELGFLSEDIPALIGECAQGSQRVSKTVSGLKSFAHPSDSTQEKISLQSAIDLAISLVNNELRHNANLQYEPGEACFVMGNLTELSQVFVNLLVNAVHAIKENGNIAINIARAARDITVTVSDNGCGITPENIDKLFQPFFTTKEIGTGTGLGLAISHGIIENHKGSITVTSKPNEGACFTVVLPAATS